MRYNKYRGKNNNPKIKKTSSKTDNDGMMQFLGKLSPQQIIVILGLLSNSLFINSVLIDKNQNIQIVVTGTIGQLTDLLKEQNMSFEDLTKMF